MGLSDYFDDPVGELEDDILGAGEDITEEAQQLPGKSFSFGHFNLGNKKQTYQLTNPANLDGKKITLEAIYSEEPNNFLDDRDTIKRTETIHLRKDINRITNIFQEAYTKENVGATPDIDQVSDSGENAALNEKADVLLELTSRIGLNKSRTKEKIKQSREKFKEYYLENIFKQKSQRKNNRRVDGYNTGRGEKEELSSKTKTHQPMGTAQINSERLGSTPETEADSVKLGS